MTAPEDTGGDERAVAGTLVEQFDRMVRRDGGSVRLLGVDGGVIRVAYAPGVDVTCETDACVLPHVELQQLMAETLARRDPGLHVAVELAERAEPGPERPSERSGMAGPERPSERESQ